MKLKVNDIVRIKSWDDMVNQYGIINDSIDIPLLFTPQMKKYCRRIYRITEIQGGETRLRSFEVYKLCDMDGRVGSENFADFTEKMFDMPEAIEALPKDKKEFNEELI